MKSPLTCLLLFCFLLAGKAQTRQAVSYFPLQDIKLLESPFLQAQQTDLHYIMAMNPDRLLAPFLREAGLAPKAPSYTNWENTGLDGHIGGHYISALYRRHDRIQPAELYAERIAPGTTSRR